MKPKEKRKTEDKTVYIPLCRVDWDDAEESFLDALERLDAEELTEGDMEVFYAFYSTHMDTL